MRALTARLPVGLISVIAVGCGGAAPTPVQVDVGVHEVSLVVPEGFAHYDHGREQRLERTEGDLVVTDLGPVASEGFSRVLAEARSLTEAGRHDDAATLLRDLEVWRVFSADEDVRAALGSVGTIANSRSTIEIEAAYDALFSLVDDLPPPDLRALAHEALAELDHNERRDIERESRLRLDGRDALQINTWQRLTHDLRRRHVFVVNRGHLLVIRTDMGRDEVLGPAFDELVRSFSFAPGATVTVG